MVSCCFGLIHLHKYSKKYLLMNINLAVESKYLVPHSVKQLVKAEN